MLYRLTKYSYYFPVGERERYRARPSGVFSSEFSSVLLANLFEGLFLMQSHEAVSSLS
ncbi:Chaperone protein DnaJ [Frankliniella fusca]|uniref:Chaperone protein DnaJ n=1 Tax=Frankliniella fusca TaxID=407009 RepID=A0AAE1HKK8_9NEOP|nr:Chaperone protein DnaJ [Frankliniella fusca]KAK3919192.1 Chaperone protein DnaJ [Frankliniella fusca]KAK3923065.1 Chaperone protein DnaJ [Frankliniella fusca]